MKKLDNYGVEKLSLTESKLIFGGGFFRSFGRMVGEAWCATKGFIKELASHSDKVAHPGSTFQ